MEPAAQHKILLVEDDAATSEVISENLKMNGYHVAIAPDGQQGLGLALSLHPDLILLDYHMSEVNGLELLAKLREDSWGKTAQVVFLTNNDDVNTVNEAMRYGVSEFVIKAEMSTDALLKLVTSKLG